MIVKITITIVVLMIITVDEGVPGVVIVGVPGVVIVGVPGVVVIGVPISDEHVSSP